MKAGGDGRRRCCDCSMASWLAAELTRCRLSVSVPRSCDWSPSNAAGESLQNTASTEATRTAELRR